MKNIGQPGRTPTGHKKHTLGFRVRVRVTVRVRVRVFTCVFYVCFMSRRRSSSLPKNGLEEFLFFGFGYGVC